MNARTLTLTAADLAQIRHGAALQIIDSDGRPVLVTTAHVPEPSGRRPQLLSSTDLDLIESPEGLGCADTERRTGWTVRMAEVTA